MKEKRHKTIASIKQGLKKSMMLLLALMFMVSIVAIAAPAVAEASYEGFVFEIRNDADGSFSRATSPHYFGDNGYLRVGYQVGTGAAQVNPITMRVRNLTGSGQSGVTLTLGGSRTGDFRVSTTSLGTIPSGGVSATFTVQPAPSLPFNATLTARRNLTITVAGQEAGSARNFTVGFTLLDRFINTQVANTPIELYFGDPVAHHQPISGLALPGEQAGTWRWINPPANIPITGANVAFNQMQQLTAEFVPNDANQRSLTTATHSVRVRVVARTVSVDNPLIPPSFYPIGLGQSLGEARLRNQNHTRGGTWVWVNAAGQDISSHRPMDIGTERPFVMQFNPAVTANFPGITPVLRRHTVRVTIEAPTLEFRANSHTLVVGEQLPAAGFETLNLVGNHQPSSLPTVAWAEGINTNTVGVFRDAIIFTSFGSLPDGNAASSYIGVTHTTGTLTVVAAGGGGGTTPPPGGVGTNWVIEGGNHYLRNAAGQNVQGWHEVGGNWFYLHTAATAARDNRPLASMATGWLRCLIYNNYYLLRDNGTMTTGWQQDDGNWYFMQYSGAMATNTWRQYGRDWYFLGANGVMETSNWVRHGGQYYWMNAEGIMVTGVHTIGGVRHRFASDGRWLGQ